MRNFEVLFDNSEPAGLSDPAYRPYGTLGFPAPPTGRPWIFSNFVQTLDGIASLRGRHASGSDISQSEEDRWLMDLLRAHSDAILLGVGTLMEEASLGVRERGPVFRIMAPELRELRRKLGREIERNIFITGSGLIDLDAFRVFDGEHVETTIITTASGAARLEGAAQRRKVRLMVAGQENTVNLAQAVQQLWSELGIRYLLCEGGPTVYGSLVKAGLIDEKFVTVAPIEVGQVIPPEQEKTELERLRESFLRPTVFSGVGFTKQEAPWWSWLSCRRVGDHQFSRYRRKR